MRLAWLFDIDGTLLLTEGAGRQAFAHAARAVLGVEDDLEGVAFAGRTEPKILADILRQNGLAPDEALEPRFWDAAFDDMKRRLVPGRGTLLPGVPALLDAVDREPDWVGGLLTGNMTQMARIKLRHFGLEERFRFGGFGEEAADRDQLARLVVERVRERYGIPAGRCVVVGDTEHDVACARAAGARVVAVATGSQSRDELEALRPDLTLEDLSDTAALMDWARAVATGSSATD